jgi:rod shape-determining protein MreC
MNVFLRLFANRRLFVLLLAVILLTVSVGMTRGEREKVTWVEAGVKNTVAWLSSWIPSPSRLLAEGSPEGKGEEGEEILQLKAELSRLKQENRQLKEAADYIDKNKESYITAQTVARSPDRWNDRLVIDKGKKDGIQRNMPVVTHEGLIGRVSAVTDQMADIQLLTDSGSTPGIAAHVLAGEEIFGLIEGYDEKSKRLLMKKIPSGVQLKKGQLVVTSGMSEIFPGNLLIGTVDKVTTGDFGVDQMVYVKPATRFERLQYVMVVRDPAKIQLKKHRQKLDSKDERNGGN